MNEITIDDVSKIIFDIRDKYKITDKRFEIFALAAVLEELKIEDFYGLSIMRSSTTNNEYNFQLQFPSSPSIYGRYDKEENKFVALHERNAVKSISHAVHTDKEMGILKDIYNLFENNLTFEDFKKDFQTNLSQKIDETYIEQLNNLYSKSFDFNKLIFMKYLKEVETIDDNNKHIDRLNLAQNLFATGISKLPILSKYPLEESMITLVSTNTYEDKIYSGNFESVLQYDNLNARLSRHSMNTIELADITKIKQLLNTDYVKNNTLSGVIMDEDKILSEKLYNIVGLFYDDIREEFINSLENVTLLKTREQLSVNFHIDEIKNRILEQFPTAFNDKDLRLFHSTEVGEFTSNKDESSKLYIDYLKSIKKFGLIRGIDLVSMLQRDINFDAFFEEAYSKGKRVTLKGTNEVETLYQYTFKEFDVYGVKLLEPKDIYMSKELGYGNFNNSLDEMINYAKKNNCIIVTSEMINDDALLDGFSRYLEDYDHDDVVFYDRNSYEEKNHLNIALGLQKEYGDKMKFENHIELKDFSISKSYIEYDELTKKGHSIINAKHEKKIKINGPR